MAKGKRRSSSNKTSTLTASTNPKVKVQRTEPVFRKVTAPTGIFNPLANRRNEALKAEANKLEENKDNGEKSVLEKENLQNSFFPVKVASPTNSSLNPNNTSSLEKKEAEQETRGDFEEFLKEEEEEEEKNNPFDIGFEKRKKESVPKPQKNSNGSKVNEETKSNTPTPASNLSQNNSQNNQHSFNGFSPPLHGNFLNRFISNHFNPKKKKMV